MRLITALFLGLLLSVSAYSQNEETSPWEADLDYLAKELSARHYNFFSVKDKEYFLSGIERLKRESRNLTDFQIALKTQQLIAEFGDSHTMLSFLSLLDPNQLLPMHLLWTSDGLHIAHTTSGNEGILGMQLLSINQLPIETVIDSLSTLLTMDNRSMVKTSVPRLLPSLQILEFFGITDSEPTSLGLKTNSGEVISYAMTPVVMTRSNRVSFVPDSLAFCVKNESAYFTDAYFPEEKIHYILYNRCAGREVEMQYGDPERAASLPSFKEFEERVFAAIEQEPVAKIIFDMRYNGGGSSAQGTKFIERLAKYLEKNPEVRTYVVLGRNTFSSAILNAMDFKRLTNAIFVGEETAGRPNHFGEVRSFQLPNSRIQVNYSTKYFQMTDEDVSTIEPDVKIEMNFQNFKQGIDPVFEWVKAQ